MRDPESFSPWIRDSGWKNSGSGIKHPGSATLLGAILLTPSPLLPGASWRRKWRPLWAAWTRASWRRRGSSLRRFGSSCSPGGGASSISRQRQAFHYFLNWNRVSAQIFPLTFFYSLLLRKVGFHMFPFQFRELFPCLFLITRRSRISVVALPFKGWQDFPVFFVSDGKGFDLLI
jgi:hypothetical protein